MKWPARNKLITICFGLALMILVAIGILATQSTINVAESIASNDLNYQRIAALRSISSDLQTAELAYLGYVVTGAEEDVQRCRSAQKSASEEIKKQQALTDEDAEQRQRLDSLRKQVTIENANLEKRIALRKQQGFDPTSAEVRAVIAKSVLPDVQRLVTQIENAEQQLMSRRREEAQTRAHWMIIVFAAGNIISFALLYVVLNQFDKQIRDHMRDKEALKRTQDELEHRVQERTADLDRTIAVLRKEIVERQSIEAALSESEGRYRLMADNTVDMIARKTPEGEFLYVSPSCRTLLGYEPQELIGRSLYELLHHDDVESVSQAHQNILAGSSSNTITYRLRCKDGRAIWFETNIRAIRETATNEVTELVAISRDISRRKQILEELHRLSMHLMQSQDEERRRIARELHDSTAQNLTAVMLNLARLQKKLNGTDSAARKIADESTSLTEECLREIRTLSYLLHPPMLDEAGLASALRWYANGFAKRSGIRVDLELPALERLPAEVERTLFRVAQESLSNVHRHSESRTASIELTKNGQTLTLEIKDRGKGIHHTALGDDSDAVKPLGVGITGMQERLRQLGGRLEVNSGKQGTTVRAVLPLGKDKQ